MKETIKARYRNGVFAPSSPVSVVDGTEVLLTIEGPVVPRMEPQGSDRFEGLFGILPREDAREWNRIIEEEFEQVNPDEWRS